MTIGKLVSFDVEAPCAARIAFDDGATGLLDFAPVLARHPVLAPLQEGFACASLSEDGWSVQWPDGIELGAPQLRRWLEEQAAAAIAAQ
jgi:hypothetical protein